MSDLIGLTASAAGGGIFGLLGTALGRVAGYFERRQEHAHAREGWHHELQRLQLQRQAQAEAADAERALAETTGSWAGLKASIDADAAIGSSYRWVSAVRGLTRPALTFLLWGIAIVIFMGADAAGRQTITETATFAATAATLWWFGDRGPRREARR